MFYVRHPKEKGQELIGQALATLWMVVHSVQGIMFKDLKQILRKEQVRYHLKFAQLLGYLHIEFLTPNKPLIVAFKFFIIIQHVNNILCYMSYVQIHF